MLQAIRNLHEADIFRRLEVDIWLLRKKFISCLTLGIQYERMFK